MSYRRFAPITSDLLARKGEAAPSTLPSAVKRPLFWSVDPTVANGFVRHEHAEPSPIIAEHEPPAELHDHFLGHRHDEPGVRARDAERPRKILVALSAREHEALGIIAVKRDSTRHQVVRDALDAYLDKAAQEYRVDCACIAAGAPCANRCNEI